MAKKLKPYSSNRDEKITLHRGRQYNFAPKVVASIGVLVPSVFVLSFGYLASHNFNFSNVDPVFGWSVFWVFVFAPIIVFASKKEVSKDRSIEITMTSNRMIIPRGLISRASGRRLLSSPKVQQVELSYSSIYSIIDSPLFFGEEKNEHEIEINYKDLNGRSQKIWLGVSMGVYDRLRVIKKIGSRISGVNNLKYSTQSLSSKIIVALSMVTLVFVTLGYLIIFST